MDGRLIDDDAPNPDDEAIRDGVMMLSPGERVRGNSVLRAVCVGGFESERPSRGSKPDRWSIYVARLRVHGREFVRCALVRVAHHPNDDARRTVLMLGAADIRRGAELFVQAFKASKTI